MLVIQQEFLIKSYSIGALAAKTVSFLGISHFCNGK